MQEKLPCPNVVQLVSRLQEPFSQTIQTDVLLAEAVLLVFIVPLDFIVVLSVEHKTKRKYQHLN